MKNQILIFLMLAGAMYIRAQNGSLGRITISSCGTNDSRLSVTMGEPLSGSFISSDGKTILTVGAQAGHTQNIGDSLSLSTYSISIDSNSSNFDINLYSNRSWQINNPASWLAISTLSGYKDVKLSFSAAVNTGINSRTAEVIVSAGSNIKTVIINQNGKYSTIDKIGYENQDLLIYPNPFSNWLTLEVVDGNKDYFVKILNHLGQTVYQNNLLIGKGNILLPDLVDGTYFLQLFSSKDEYLKTYKITKINNN